MIANFIIMFIAYNINATKGKNLAGKQILNEVISRKLLTAKNYSANSFTSIFSRSMLAGPVTTKPFVL